AGLWTEICVAIPAIQAAAGVNLMTCQPSGSVIGRGPTLQLGSLTYLFSILPVAASRICGSSNCSIYRFPVLRADQLHLVDHFHLTDSQTAFWQPFQL